MKHIGQILLPDISARRFIRINEQRALVMHDVSAKACTDGRIVTFVIAGRRPADNADTVMLS